MAAVLPPPPPLSTLSGTIYNPFPNYNACAIRVNVHSPAVWDLPQPSDFFRYPLTLLHLQLAFIFTLTQCLHFCLKRFHLPRFTSELLAGIILGPTVLGHIPGFRMTFFPEESVSYLNSLSTLGYIFFIFLSGLKMNPKLVLTSGASNLTAWTIGTIAPLIPFAGSISMAKFYRTNLVTYRLRIMKDVLSVQNIFSFPVIFSLLNDLKIMNSELGRLALTSALISDLISNTLFSISANIGMGYVGWKNILGVFNLLLMLVAICNLVLPAKPLSKWIIGQTQEGRQINRAYVIILSASVLSATILSDNSGMFYHHGPFVLGLALPDGPPLGSTMVLKLETLVSGLFAPLFVTIGGLKMNMSELYDMEFLGFIVKNIIACLTMKYAAVLFPALASKMPTRDAFALAFIMSAQGVVQMSFYILMNLIQSIDQEAYSVVVFSLFILATGVQLCVRSLYDHTRIYSGYQKRDIQHISHNAELRVLVASNRPDDALAVKRLLEASIINIECPLSVYALTLVELVGRSHPLLIDHQLGQKSSTVVGPHVQKILEVFQSFKEQYIGMVSVQMFTAMSLSKFMHDDVCSLAFDKMTSLIILPFHVKWNNQGKIIVHNASVRAMNCHVLDMAPCSVGILIDRHRIKTSSSSSAQSSVYNVAIIFIGGNDDREGLAYGKRMARSSGIHLTVVRFIPRDPAAQNQWDAVMDAEMLKEMRLPFVQALILIFAAKPLLRYMGIKSDSPMLAPAEKYLTVRSLGSPAVLLSLAMQGIFRGFKDTKTPLFASVIGDALNIVLDPLLIFVFRLGITGAAIAHVTSQYVISIILLWKLTQQVYLLPPNLKELQFGRFIKSGSLLLFKVLASTSCVTLAASLATRLGTTPMAAFQICLQVWLATSLLADGLAVSGQAILASAFARNDYEKTSATASRVLQLGVILGLVLSLFVTIFLKFGGVLFTNNVDVLRVLSIGIPFVAATQPINALAFVFDGINYGANDFAYSAISLVGVACVTILSLFLLSWLYGFVGLWIALSIFMSLRAFAGFWRIGTRTGPWNYLRG